VIRCGSGGGGGAPDEHPIGAPLSLTAAGAAAAAVTPQKNAPGAVGAAAAAAGVAWRLLPENVMNTLMRVAAPGASGSVLLQRRQNNR
jgi:hypothetical protein